ncbi:mitochondrial ribonuclease P protein 1 homolog [Drosophila albomicans]|uniref:RNA (guanine-9-)-methyltransferase domain-containing protein 1 n=1 Tax=Drosophila albomicans TaxID=7291 RepID=A0A6P8X611_DROAB|nr:mitochondrial ribonuclease P protein 1 homolog [Drosophila albomicans]
MLRNLVRWQACRILLNKSAVAQVAAVRHLSNPFKQNPHEKAATEEPATRIKKPGNPFAKATVAQELSFNVEEPETVIDKPVNPFGKAPVAQELPSSQHVSETKEEREKRLKVLQLEVDIAYQEGRRVPALEFFQEHHWARVLELPTKSARSKYYAFLWQIEMKKESNQRKKEERAVETERRVAEIRKERAENNHIVYGLAHTSMFLRIYDSTINHWQNNRLTRAMQFAPKLVLDCSYDQYMTNRESSYAAKQLMLCFAENRMNDEPFDLHYCNSNFEGNCMQILQRYIPTMHNPEFPINVHRECFTELFPKKQLVYLTPHCREDLVSYDPDDIYIVGAMVDTVNNEPLSLAKAKRLGLRMARLPLDRYLQWGAGSGKSLTLNQMISIMLDLKKTGDWDTALQHVPRRKVVDYHNEREALNKRAGKFNVRIDHLLKSEGDRRTSTAFAEPQKLRHRKEGMDFKLDSWATGKRKTKQSS